MAIALSFVSAQSDLEEEDSSQNITFSREKLVVLPIVLNIVPAFGMGSDLQGDDTGATVGYWLTTIALLGIGVPLGVILGFGIMGGVLTLGGALFAIAPFIEPMFIVGACIAGVAELANIIWGIGRPIYFRAAYLESEVGYANNSVRNVTKRVSFSILPIATTKEFGAMAVVRY